MGDQPDPSDSTAKRVVVLGGGLAGLSAARCLVERGFDVTLVEKRPFLGGRAFSFTDPQEGVEVDNGQHVFLGCCSYYIDFLEAIGALDKTYLPNGLRMEVVIDGKRGVLSSMPRLRRLHLLPSFLLYPHLGIVDKLMAAYGMLRVRLTNRRKHSASLDRQTAYAWLKAHHQTERTIENLWNLVIRPALNDDVRDVSADMALMVFQEALLKTPADAAIGFPKVGLSTLNGEHARRFLQGRSANVVMGRSVTAIKMDDGLVRGVEISGGETLQADAYLSALPFKVLSSILPDDVSGSPFFASAADLSTSPIVGIHIWYDRPVMEGEFVAFVESPVQWVFNKSAIQDLGGTGQYICISLSGAWDLIDTPKDELRELFTHEMAKLFPRARDAHVERFLVVKEPQATFRSAPGAAEHRLPQRTPISNLFLAGEWTQTGWPSTMEGAVRSGAFAADAVAEANPIRA